MSPGVVGERAQGKEPWARGGRGSKRMAWRCRDRPAEPAHERVSAMSPNVQAGGGKSTGQCTTRPRSSRFRATSRFPADRLPLSLAASTSWAMIPPHITLRLIHRCSEPYLPALLGCACPLLRPDHRFHPQKTVRSRDAPQSDFHAEPFIEAAVIGGPTLAWPRSSPTPAPVGTGPPGISHHASPRAATRSEMRRRFKSDTAIDMAGLPPGGSWPLCPPLCRLLLLAHSLPIIFCTWLCLSLAGGRGLYGLRGTVSPTTHASRGQATGCERSA